MKFIYIYIYIIDIFFNGEEHLSVSQEPLSQ